jgi:hypothetical protein
LPNVVFTIVHHGNFYDLDRHKVLVIAPVKEFALTLTVKKSDDHMKPLIMIRAHNSMTLVAVAVHWLAISRFDLLSSVP